MKITVEIDTNDFCPNEKGEFLRDYVFKQKVNGRWKYTGCYSTFEVKDDFVEIKPKKYPVLYKEIAPKGFPRSEIKNIKAYENEKVVAIWHWDGDGTLIVYIKDEPTFLYNGDCKKDYIWEQHVIGW
jgi:hypothetical protein